MTTFLSAVPSSDNRMAINIQQLRHTTLWRRSATQWQVSSPPSRHIALSVILPRRQIKTGPGCKMRRGAAHRRFDGCQSAPCASSWESCSGRLRTHVSARTRFRVFCISHAADARRLIAIHSIQNGGNRQPPPRLIGVLEAPAIELVLGYSRSIPRYC